jgi:hypothetical protein
MCAFCGLRQFVAHDWARLGNVQEAGRRIIEAVESASDEASVNTSDARGAMYHG